jgi:adenylyltransferase/sulfurtransferase
MSFSLARDLLDQIRAHAEGCFPHECCGFVVRRDGARSVVHVTNIQNQKHAEDPENFPRTAEIAYTMGPEAAPLMIEHDRGRLVIEAIYHSHPQHDAYFSPTDRKQATVWDEPSYPNAAQIVVSVYDRVAKAVKAFGWDASAHDFVEIELRVEGA